MPDKLDMQLLHALQIDGRAPFSAIAQVLGVSDQTVARRYSRLHEAGMLRVRGLTEPSRINQTRWIVRVQCTPSAAAAMADALARRTDTSWISLTSGGTEVVCAVRSDTTGENGNRLLLQTLPRTRQVVAMTAHCLLHEFFGGGLGPISKSGALSSEQVARLRPTARTRPTAPSPLREADRRLLEALANDGRATVGELAAASGLSETTVRRRMADLQTSGTLYFDVDFEQGLLDLHVRAMLWLSVAPAQLADTGRALAEHPETAFVAATTGAANLYASVVCPDTATLYEYLTTSIASLPAVERIETVPILRTVKHSGILGQP
jgi:DNA-binding Lrp family transcriptional regulator